MQIDKVTVDIKAHKPNMKTMRSIEEIPLNDTIITAKLDGEFTLFYHSPEHTYIVNGWGTMRRHFPALTQGREALLRLGYRSYVLKCELYAVKEDSEDPLQLHEFLSLAKGKNADPDRLRLGFWDILTIDGKPPMLSYGDRLNLMGYWFISTEFCNPVPYIRPDNRDQIQDFWDSYVVRGRHEGVVVHIGNDIYKVKPELDVDVVIIALNKTKVFAEGKVGSVLTALMTEDGRFVKLSDVSIPSKMGLRETMYNAVQYKVAEDADHVWIQPLIVITVRYNETIPSEKQTWKFEDGQYIKGEKIPLVSLKHPRLHRFRRDKKVNPTDLRLSQIGGFP